MTILHLYKVSWQSRKAECYESSRTTWVVADSICAASAAVQNPERTVRGVELVASQDGNPDWRLLVLVAGPTP